MKSHNDPHLFPFGYKLGAGLLLFAGMFFAALTLGAADTTVRDVWLALTTSAKTDAVLILREIRIPREVGAMVSGAALAVAGAIMQGMTRNPLADPGLLGLTAGANAALAITLAFIPSADFIVITIASFIGAAAGTAFVFGLGSLNRGGFSPLRIVLAGAAVSAFLYAVAEAVSYLFKLSKDVTMWTSAGTAGTSWSQLQIIVPVIMGGIIISFILSKQLTVLSLSEETAIGLGQNIPKIKAVLFAVIILLAGAAVALVGNLAFIGLMIPHIVRAVVGMDYRYVIPMSAICGATFMLLADTLGRTIYAPYEVPAAAIVAAMGLPFFLFIVRKGGRVFS
ncbi:FecCD family ABC transporter permease [Peribacillus sp. SCS-26]|uniref:FecCD family ABC transporter permease n=1 Tax=Paraperibacillus marinus TaxID=3115295 RepID=UPI003905BC88